MDDRALGALRSDLVAIARVTVAMSRSSEGQAHACVSCRGAGLGALLHCQIAPRAREAIPRSVVEAERARHELADNVDATLLFDVLSAALHNRLFSDREDGNDAFISRLLDLLLFGALVPE